MLMQVKVSFSLDTNLLQLYSMKPAMFLFFFFDTGNCVWDQVIRTVKKVFFASAHLYVGTL